MVLARWFVHPGNVEGFRHMEQHVATRPIARGASAVRQFGSHRVDLSDVEFEGSQGRSTVGEFAKASHTNAWAVMRGDSIVWDWYAPGMTQSTRHLLMSMSKSFTALLAGDDVQSGRLDLRQQASFYVPELAGGAYAGATVQDLLNMAVSVDYGMDFSDPSSAVVMHDRSAGWHPKVDGEPTTLRSFLVTLGAGPASPGRAFQYCSATTDVLAWVIERAAGRSLASLLSDRLWSRIGAERDGMITVDAEGTPYAAAGMCATLPDLLRVGRMILDGGRVNDDEVIPSGWLQSIMDGTGDGDAGMLVDPSDSDRPSSVYRYQWWHVEGASVAAGLGGQYLWLDHDRDVIVAKLSAAPATADPSPAQADHFAAFSAIAECLATVGVNRTP